MLRNLRVTCYNGVPVKVTVCSKAVYVEHETVTDVKNLRRQKDFDNKKATDDDESVIDVETVTDDDRSVIKSKRRARNAVFDYVGCNPDLDLFITFTLSPEKINRYDYDTVKKPFQKWLDNRVQRRGLKYVFVVEKHKDGAIHFHGLVNSATCKLVDSGHKDRKGHTVYNVSDWTLGFSTAIRVYGQRSSVCKYIVKYITKADEKVGGRWYYSGGQLEKPTYVYEGVYENPNQACANAVHKYFGDVPVEMYDYDVQLPNEALKFCIAEVKNFEI